MLAIGAVVSISSTDPYIKNRRAATGTGFPGPFEDIPAMDGFSLAAKQIALCASQGDPFG